MNFFDRQVSPVHPTTEGCVVLIQDDESNTTYRLHLDKVFSEVIVDEAKKYLMFSEIEKAWEEKDERDKV